MAVIRSLILTSAVLPYSAIAIDLCEHELDSPARDFNVAPEEPSWSTTPLPTIAPLTSTTAVVDTYTETFLTSVNLQNNPTSAAQSRSTSSSLSMTTSSGTGAFSSGFAGGIVGGLVTTLLVFAASFMLRWWQDRSGRGHGLRSRDHFREQAEGTSADVEHAQFASSEPVFIHAMRDTDSRSSLLRLSTGHSSVSGDSIHTRSYPDLTTLRSGFSDAITPPMFPSSVRSSAAPSEIVFAHPPLSSSPPSHSVDVPDPALSVTGTEWSTRHDGLAQQIRTLEARIQELHYPEKLEEARSPNQEKRERTRALKNQIAELSAKIERERRLILEAAPRRGRRGKPLTVVN
ncbi:hypothetical protein BN946_scf184867.g18 [Trametes cinnabarina]|uniref:Uncharacterized protein n=1 Tax=Pycnoporus cinnabarinus TaxID=5643 RepID=A0A060SJ54_PYCCI|nr:hypothetical protein BN946_scf184867.g18 [Trametes cinnabarina]